MSTDNSANDATNHDPPLSKKAGAFFNATREVELFISKKVSPVLTKKSTDEKEKALSCLFLRIALHLGSLVKLNHPRDFQAVAMISRSIFELLLDLKILEGDTDGSLTKKFFAFQEIEKYRTAKQLVDLETSNPDILPDDLTHQKKFLNTRTEPEINAKKLHHWNSKENNWPQHWTGESTKKRAERLGKSFLSTYTQRYALESWYVHSGAMGFAGVSTENFTYIFALSHSCILNHAVDALHIIVKAFKLGEGDPDCNLSDEIENLRLAPGFFLLSEEELKLNNE
jgi:hypothetical protein